MTISHLILDKLPENKSRYMLQIETSTGWHFVEITEDEWYELLHTIKIKSTRNQELSNYKRTFYEIG